jgi:hypothetical protein
MRVGCVGLAGMLLTWSDAPASMKNTYVHSEKVSNYCHKTDHISGPTLVQVPIMNLMMMNERGMNYFT